MGVPVTTIAQELGISRNYVYIVLGMFPKCPSDFSPISTMSPELEYKIVSAYAERFPPKQVVKDTGRQRVIQEIVEAISEELDLQEEQIYNALYRMSALHPAAISFPLYSNIEKWKTQEIVSIRDIAKRIQVPAPELSDILYGLRHMPLDYAERIKALSGLKIAEIYSDLLELDESNKGAET